MISAPLGRARTRRLLLIGLMLSLMVHLAGGSLYGLLARVIDKALPHLASKRSTDVSRSDIIRLEKVQPAAKPIAVAPPIPKPPPPPPPVPRVRPQPIVAPAEHPHELAHITVHAPRQYAPSRGVSPAEPPQHTVLPPAAPRAPKQPYYSDAQIAAMNGAFAQSISSSHQTLQQANAAVETAPVITQKHYQMSFNGIHEGMNPGDGIITYTKFERHGDTMYYWTHYEYMYGDGHVEEDDIPWPFHYPIRDDPFARHDRRIPLQAPPADYRPNRPLKPILQQFFGGPQVS